MKEPETAVLSPAERKRKLFLDQKRLLDTFLDRRAISRAQYDKSLGCLAEKMGMQALLAKGNESADKID